MAEFLTTDCSGCGTPEISLKQCARCDEAFCKHCVEYCMTFDNNASEYVCRECILEAELKPIKP